MKAECSQGLIYTKQFWICQKCAIVRNEFGQQTSPVSFTFSNTAMEEVDDQNHAVDRSPPRLGIYLPPHCSISYRVGEMTYDGWG